MNDVAVLLVGGHESADGEDLARLRGAGLDAAPTAAGRALHDKTARLLDGGRTVVVVPMTFGRDVTMVADAAKTLKWLAANHRGRIALAGSFGTADHLGAWLRTAANRAGAVDPSTVMLVQIPRSNPFDEAEMSRIAYLVGAYGALPEIGVTVGLDAASAARSVDRMHRLGHPSVAIVPGGFAAAPLVPRHDGASSAGPLMTDASITRIVRERVAEALADLAAGDDGIESGLLADHGHGYAHSHAFEEGGSHSHGHAHQHSHQHGHPHEHVHEHGTADAVEHGHPHEHGHAHEHEHRDGHGHDHDDETPQHRARHGAMQHSQATGGRHVHDQAI